MVESRIDIAGPYMNVPSHLNSSNADWTSSFMNHSISPIFNSLYAGKRRKISSPWEMFSRVQKHFSLVGESFFEYKNIYV